MSENYTLDIINSVKSIPKKIFIVPYRNRPQQKFFFEKYMNFILEYDYEYEIYFSHQCDERSFNRGATKNIGFLAMKAKYPNHYKNINFIFNDVDTMPFHKLFDYETSHGVVKHYYGFNCTLGGIVVMKGSDFEKVNGYPNYWAWGNEDNCLQKRCEESGVIIDRSVFYKIGSPEILQLFDGITRIINRTDYMNMIYDNFNDGLSSINCLHYTIDDKSSDPRDNLFVCSNERINIINITTFETLHKYEEEELYNHDLRDSRSDMLCPAEEKKIDKMLINSEKKKVRFVEPENSIENKRLSSKNSPISKQPLFKKPPTINRYSPYYASSMGIRPKSVPSASIGLGGIR
jgi:hypothetical protein